MNHPKMTPCRFKDRIIGFLIEWGNLEVSYQQAYDAGSGWIGAVGTRLLWGPNVPLHVHPPGMTYEERFGSSRDH